MTEHSSLHDVVRLDFEHAEQYRMLRELRQAFAIGAETAVMQHVLVEFNLSHGQLEEMLMEERAYPGLDVHAADHALLQEALAGIADAAGVDAVVARLRRHIGDHDARLVAFLDKAPAAG
jgi:hemerythrin